MVGRGRLGWVVAFSYSSCSPDACCTTWPTETPCRARREQQRGDLDWWLTCPPSPLGRDAQQCPFSPWPPGSGGVRPWPWPGGRPSEWECALQVLPRCHRDCPLSPWSSTSQPAFTSLGSAVSPGVLWLPVLSPVALAMCTV